MPPPPSPVGALGLHQDFVHRLRGIAAEAQQVEVGEGHHDVICLPADPSAHVDVAVRSTRTRRVHGETNASEACAAVAASAAGDVEGDGHNVAFLDVEHVAARFNHFPGYFVTENEAGGGCRAAADLRLKRGLRYDFESCTWRG